jgi:hypothetical protein
MFLISVNTGGRLKYRVFQNTFIKLDVNDTTCKIPMLPECNIVHSFECLPRYFRNMETDEVQESNGQEVPVQSPEDVSETDAWKFSSYGR